MPGMASNFDMSGVLGHVAEDQSQANRKNVLRAAQQRLHILCSGDRNGIICLSAFGVFPIGKLVSALALKLSFEFEKCDVKFIYDLRTLQEWG